MKELKGALPSDGWRIGIIVSRFNEIITERLLQGALDVLRRTGIAQEQLIVAHVPGSFEIPLAAQKLAQSGKVDAVICLGALIRGETPHFDYLAREVTRGLGEVSIKCDLPIAYGILTTDTVDQAFNRAGAKQGNKGAEAALAVIEMISLVKQVDDLK